ncbi:MAG TPA: hypothetical protein VFX85_01305 [Solirubrobacterales bacterium]|nr:hypothetical protein [Solirubrobacterales bacterium]
MAAVLLCSAWAPQAFAAPATGHTALAPITGTPASSFALGSALAIDEAAGRLYMRDSGAGSIKAFDLTSGELVGELTTEDIPGLPFGSQMEPRGPVAVDNTGGATQGQVYVSALKPGGESIGRVYVFDASGAYLSTLEGTGTPQGFFAGAPWGLAVDGAGQLLVSDATNEQGSNAVDHYAIHRFSPGGAYLSQILTNPSEGYPAGLDVDSAGNVYVQKFYRSRVDKYGPGGALLDTIDTDTPVSVAVDSSNDHVYVANGTFITEYDESGTFVGRFGTGHVTANASLAVDSSSGRLYDLEEDRVEIFDVAATFTVPDVSIDPVVDVDYFEASVTGEVDPDGAPGKYFFEYRRQGSNNDWQATPIQDAGDGTDPVPVSATISGLQAGSAYFVRLVGIAPDGEASSVTPTEAFTTETATPPALTIDPVSGITADGAHLSGTVNPNDIPTKARFEYSEDGWGWRALPDQDVGDGTTPVLVEADLTDLDPNTHYFVRLTAENQATSAVSSEIGFDTLPVGPTAFTSGAAPRAETTARLHGYVNPRKTATSYHFEFGSDSSYGTTFPAAEIGAGKNVRSVSQAVTGLQPGTTYHYRVVAESPAGTAVGEDIAFTTRTAAEGGPRERGVELVNNPEKGNQPARPGSGASGSPVASRNADRVLWSTVGGAPGGSLGTGSIFMAQRTSQGWASINTLPPRDQLVDNGESPYLPLAASPGFDRFLYTVQNGVNDITLPIIVAADNDGSDQRIFGVVDPAERTAYRGNDDFSHVYSVTQEPIAPGAPAGVNQLYDFSYDPPQLVSAAPNGTPIDCGLTVTVSGEREFGAGAYEWVSTDPQASPRVFFESTGESTPCPAGVKVYMRDQASQTTTLLSGPALPGGPQNEEGSFVRASADGTEVLFTAESRLTAEDTNNGGDIYLYSDAAGRKCLTCVGRGAALNSIGGRDNRFVVASEDLSYVYFTSSNVLVPGAGEQGGSNTYLYRGGEIEYVGPGASLEHQRTELTDGGKVLFFLSENPETTNDDTGGFTQVYRYDADDRSVECVSCKPGVTPTAPAFITVPVTAARGGLGLSAENGDSFVFSTYGALERRDINLANDVYEWRNGQVKLVTDGVSEPSGVAGVGLIGQGRDNMNVLFTSGNNLTGFERDNIGQLYALRIGGGGRPPTPLPPCESGDCQGPLVAPPGFAEPGSRSLRGAGNEPGEAEPKKRKARKCAKGRKATKSGKGKARCVKTKKAKKAKSNRGAK